MEDEKDLCPDGHVLSGIFPTIHNITEDASYSVISSTFDTCTFRLQSSAVSADGFPQDLLIRIEKAQKRISTVAALQRLAHSQIPDTVLAPLHVGTTTDSTGRSLDYMVTEFLSGTKSLEDIWDDLTAENQQALVESVASEMEKLQKIELKSAETLHQVSQFDIIGEKLAESTPFPLGNLEVGFHFDIKQFICAIVEQNLHICKADQTADGIIISPTLKGLEAPVPIEFSQGDLIDLHHHAVFCHNDLEPRNILVKEGVRMKGDQEEVFHELVSIIDWEMAGIHPFAYEFGLKDDLLGSSNLHFTWYSLFKKQTALFLPDGVCHSKLIKLLQMILQSEIKQTTRNVGLLVRKRFLERLSLTLSPHVEDGWIRDKDAENGNKFRKEDRERLEHDVLKELGYI